MERYLKELCDKGSLVEVYADLDTADMCDVGVICGVGEDCFSVLTLSKSGSLSSTIVHRTESVRFLVTNSSYLKHIETMADVGQETLYALSRKGRYLPPDFLEALQHLQSLSKFATVSHSETRHILTRWDVEDELLVGDSLDPDSNTFGTVAFKVTDVESLEAFSPKLLAMEASGQYSEAKKQS